MEASDPFETAARADEADPFAEIEADAAAAEADAPTVVHDPPADEAPLPADTPSDPPADAPPAEEPPIVDREGEPVEQPGVPATASAAGRRMAAKAAAQADAKAAESAQEPPADPEEAVEGTGTTEPSSETPPAPPAEREAGKGELRRYKLLYQTGPAQWTETPLDEVPNGVQTEVDEQSGEKWLMCRNADHARRLAYSIFGRPEEGVRVVPVAGTSWKPKLVKPAPPKPDRERLEIV